MAASLKAKSAEHFKRILDLVGCPLTEGVDESWITELIFTPGEPRIRLLQWLFAREDITDLTTNQFDARLNDVIDPQFTALAAKMDSRLQRILFVASSLGLCSPDDADLIKGSTSAAKQISFMTQLLDLVKVCEESEEPQHRSSLSPGLVGPGVSLRDQYREDCQYVDMLANECDTAQMFASRTKLLPPDIARQLERNKPATAQQADLPTVPEIRHLEELAEDCARQIDRQTDVLMELKQQYQFPSSDDVMNETKVQTTLRLVLTELQQLVMGFSHCYELEVKAWCNKQRPHLTQLGPAFGRVHDLLSAFCTLLSGMTSIQKSHISLCSQIRGNLEKIREQEQQRQGSQAGYLDTQQVREYVSILEDSLVRMESALDMTSQSTLPADCTVSTIRGDSS